MRDATLVLGLVVFVALLAGHVQSEQTEVNGFVGTFDDKNDEPSKDVAKDDEEGQEGQDDARSRQVRGTRVRSSGGSDDSNKKSSALDDLPQAVKEGVEKIKEKVKGMSRRNRRDAEEEGHFEAHASVGGNGEVDADFDVEAHGDIEEDDRGQRGNGRGRGGDSESGKGKGRQGGNGRGRGGDSEGQSEGKGRQGSNGRGRGGDSESEQGSGRQRGNGKGRGGESERQTEQGKGKQGGNGRGRGGDSESEQGNGRRGGNGRGRSGGSGGESGSGRRSERYSEGESGSSVRQGRRQRGNRDDEEDDGGFGGSWLKSLGGEEGSGGLMDKIKSGIKKGIETVKRVGKKILGRDGEAGGQGNAEFSGSAQALTADSGVFPYVDEVGEGMESLRSGRSRRSPVHTPDHPYRVVGNMSLIAVYKQDGSINLYAGVTLQELGTKDDMYAHLVGEDNWTLLDLVIPVTNMDNSVMLLKIWNVYPIQEKRPEDVPIYVNDVNEI